MTYNVVPRSGQARLQYEKDIGRRRGIVTWSGIDKRSKNYDYTVQKGQKTRMALLEFLHEHGETSLTKLKKIFNSKASVYLNSTGKAHCMTRFDVDIDGVEYDIRELVQSRPGENKTVLWKLSPKGIEVMGGGDGKIENVE